MSLVRFEANSFWLLIHWMGRASLTGNPTRGPGQFHYSNVERPEAWYVGWPLIETADEMMVFCSGPSALHRSTDPEYADRTHGWRQRLVALPVGAGPFEEEDRDRLVQMAYELQPHLVVVDTEGWWSPKNRWGLGEEA